MKFSVRNQVTVLCTQEQPDHVRNVVLYGNKPSLGLSCNFIIHRLHLLCVINLSCSVLCPVLTRQRTVPCLAEKESELWQFVISKYGTEPFSTKQLEKDFGNAAYATIRSFVLKFEKLCFLTSTHYGNRVKYKVAETDK